jgi:hypothetical protein
MTERQHRYKLQQQREVGSFGTEFGPHAQALLVSSAVRADTELVAVFPPDHEGARLALRVRGAQVSSLRPAERVLASAVRYAMYPLHCSLADGGEHVPPTVRTPPPEPHLALCHVPAALLARPWRRTRAALWRVALGGRSRRFHYGPAGGTAC